MDAKRRFAAIVLATFAYPAMAESEGDRATMGTVTGFYYAIPHESDYGSGVASVNRDTLHLEARYNYEALRSGSVFAGWNFAGGENVTFQVTPILGALFGEVHGVVPGIEAAVAYREVDAYVEAEYVRDLAHANASFFYAWSEIGWRPAQWLRVGLVGQRSREVQNGRDLQRGIFAQVTYEKLTLSLYGFNPDSGSRYLILSLGAQF